MWVITEHIRWRHCWCRWLSCTSSQQFFYVLFSCITHDAYSLTLRRFLLFEGEYDIQGVLRFVWIFIIRRSVVIVLTYRVIHKPLRDFRPLRYSSRDGHAEGGMSTEGKTCWWSGHGAKAPVSLQPLGLLHNLFSRSSHCRRDVRDPSSERWNFNGRESVAENFS
jgi:hypothetical protein